MKAMHIVPFLLLLAAGANAQTPTPYYIGSFSFAPQWDSTVLRLHYVRGHVGTAGDETQRLRFLTDRHFEAASRLGLNLASIVVDPNYVVTDTANPNAIRQVCAAAADSMFVAVTDWGILSYLSGERIMLHPEYAGDFSERGSYTTYPEESFDNIPLPYSNFSTPLTETNPTSNSVIIQSDKGVISGLAPIRKEDLSMFRDWWNDTLRAEKAGSGLYQLTVTVKAHNSFAESNAPIMNVAIRTLDSTGSPATLNYQLRQEQFYDAHHQFMTGAFEVELGRIEVRQSFGGVVYIRNADPNNLAWTDTTLISLAKIRDRTDTWETIAAKVADIDVAITYVSEYNAQCLLDAVCLTSPRTFNMFHIDDAVEHPDKIAAFDHALEMLRARYDAVLTNRLTPSVAFPNLLYIGGPEQGLHGAVWATTAFGQQILEQQSSTVMLHAASGSSEDPDVASAFNRRFASGYYGYPITMQHPRPVYPDVHPGDYHHSLNWYANRGFVDMSMQYLKLAKKRLLSETQYAWLPYIQNHTNMIHENVPNFHDNDDLREPTAAELRHQCNIALAFGSDGLVFWQFVSCPFDTTAGRPFWPPDKVAWQADSATGHPRDVAGNAGGLGFLDRGLTERRCDWNGESKWDSTATYLRGFLQPVGDTIKQNLEWQEAKIWSIRYMTGAGTNTTVSEVLSRRQDMPNPIDDADSTFVLISEFEHKITHERYLFVANGRTHPIEGHRHITVKLAPTAGELNEWKVTNVMTGDIWIVRPTDTPDNWSAENGVTEYFAPGSAALYRLEPMNGWHTDFDGTCLSGNIYIEPAAVLNTITTDHLKFQHEKGLYCDGYLFAFGSLFEPCDPELRWYGIHARNEGYVSLNNCIVDYTTTAISVGSEAWADLYQTTLSNPVFALANLGGRIYTTNTSAQSCDEAYIYSAGVYTSCLDDIVARTSAAAQLNAGIYQLLGTTVFRRSRMEGFATGILAIGGTVTGDDNWYPSFNHIEAEDAVLASTGGGYIEFGDAAGGSGTKNCFILNNTTSGANAISDSKEIRAIDNNWYPDPPILVGMVNADSPIATCPVPFTSTAQNFSKSSSSSASSPGARSALRRAYLDSNYVLLRQLLVGVLASTTTAIDRRDLNLIRMHILQLPTFEDLRDTLVLHLLSVPDLQSKLFASEILADVGRFREAYDITQSWSFIGSRELHTGALLRQALFAPFAMRGGYRLGLQALEEIKSVVGNDPQWRPVFELYPRLYSGLRLPQNDTSTTKMHARTSILDRVIPSTVEIGTNYPNPFSTLTSFTFKLPDACEVRLTVHDMLGREVAVLKEGWLDRGVHSAVLHAERLPAGMYLYRLQAGAEVRQGKMVLVR